MNELENAVTKMVEESLVDLRELLRDTGTPPGNLPSLQGARADQFRDMGLLAIRHFLQHMVRDIPAAEVVAWINTLSTAIDNAQTT